MVYRPRLEHNRALAADDVRTRLFPSAIPKINIVHIASRHTKCGKCPRTRVWLRLKGRGTARLKGGTTSGYLYPTGHLIVFDLIRYIAPLPSPRARLILCQCLVRRPRVG